MTQHRALFYLTVSNLAEEWTYYTNVLWKNGTIEGKMQEKALQRRTVVGS